MSAPVPLRAPPAASETAASRAQRLAEQAASAGADAVHDLIVALSCVRTEAEAVAGLTSVPPGQREVARRAADWARAQVDTLQALIGRA